MSIRSFVKRTGRMTSGQRQALETWLPRYSLAYSEKPLNFENIFGRDAPVILEIGFGNGQTLLEMATQNPNQNFLGIEVHSPGVGALLLSLKKQDLQNVRVIVHDAVPVLEKMIPTASLDQIWILFPDPWPKKRHHKRRLIQSAFVKLLAEKLKVGGKVHLATDWAPYADQMMCVLENESGLVNLAGKNQFAERSSRPQTRFEQRGQRLGHGVFELVFRKSGFCLV